MQRLPSTRLTLLYFSASLSLLIGGTTPAFAVADPSKDTGFDEMLNDLESLGGDSHDTKTVAPQKRLSHVTGSATVGSGDLLVGTADLKCGLGPVWRLDLGMQSTVVEGAQQSVAYNLGFNAEASESVRISFDGSFQKNAPSLEARGLSFSTEWRASDFWRSDLDTTLTLTLGGIRYQSTSTQVLVQRLAKPVEQKNVTLALTQDLGTRELTGGLSASFYGYNINATRLSELLARRAFQFPGVVGFLSGLPDQSFELNLTWSPLNAFTFRAAGSLTQVLSQEDPLKILSGGVDWAANRAWTISPDLVYIPTLSSHQISLSADYAW